MTHEVQQSPARSTVCVCTVLPWRAGVHHLICMLVYCFYMQVHAVVLAEMASITVQQWT